MTSGGHDSACAPDLSAAVALFRSLADPARLAIVHELAAGERRIVDLTRALGLAQSTVSAHVACLRECGLVDYRPVGRQSLYRLTQPALHGLLHAAEQLLAATGTAVELCPNSGGVAGVADVPA
jgi:DNA-binding transcriptional ArsR family regulator